ncbi:DUF2934 domain-containing protein [Paraburkholderia sp. LEh10]|nr:DUF2934 domain-containing protein [Paraburkholderia sp. LEh10]
MDVPVTEEQIRTLAFYLWKKDGGPGGRSGPVLGEGAPAACFRCNR